jgi:hypothetical protein
MGTLWCGVGRGKFLQAYCNQPVNAFADIWGLEISGLQAPHVSVSPDLRWPGAGGLEFWTLECSSASPMGVRLAIVSTLRLPAVGTLK